MRDGERASKADDADKFLERKTRTASAEETCGLAQSDGRQEGPLIGGQGVQAEELGGGLGKVKKNRGAGGIDGEDLAAFEAQLEANLERLHRELKAGTDQPQPVLRRLSPKAGQAGKHRPLGIPTIYDRVCQQDVSKQR